MGLVPTGPRPSGLLFGGEIADLEEFRAIRWKDMRWTDVRCHKLRVLEIENYFWLDMETIFGIIAENLDLLILRIHFVTFSKYNHHPQEREPLVLRRLTDFTFTKIEEVDEEGRRVQDIPVMRMLQRVQIPACTFFAIEMAFRDISEDLQKEFFRLVPRPIETFNRRVGSQGSGSKPPAARVLFWDDLFECRAFGNPKSSPMYSLSLKNAPRSVGVEWTRKELVDEWMETKPDIQLLYSVQDNEYKVDKIFDLEDLNDVVELEVIGRPSRRGSGGGSKLAWRLESPVTSTSGIVIGPFLRLRALRISYLPITGKEMLSMVHERYSRITKPSGMEGKGEEKKVKALIYGGITILLGRGMKKFSNSITRDIRAAPGVRDIRWDSNSQVTDDGSSSISSEESDWYPRYLESGDEEDGSQEEDSSRESEPEDE